MSDQSVLLRSTLLLCALTPSLAAGESLWVEAEHLSGIRGYCWPMGKPEMKRTDGRWGLSGPGWAAEWCQGGESGFLSIATGAEDDRAEATTTIEVPEAGNYFVWVRFGDWREKTERFQIVVEQPGAPAWTGNYGEHPVVEEDNEMKLYFGWAFGWAKQSAPLQKGPAKLTLQSTTKESVPRQIDVIVFTTDANYRPLMKERPRSAARDLLDSFRAPHAVVPTHTDMEERVRMKGPGDSAAYGLHGLEPLARRAASFNIPAAWNLRTFRDKGFLYLWNVSHTNAAETWLSDKPNRVKFPYNIADASVRENFEALYGGRDDVPIFSDPRVAPTFHGVGAGVFATDPATGELLEVGQRFSRWLDANPDRAWAMMMNYHPGVPIGEQGIAAFHKYRDRYAGSIAGESLGYFYPDAEQMKQATARATTRRQLVEAMTPLFLEENRRKYQQVYGRDLDANPYEDVIACLSTGNILAIPLCSNWGARVNGYESSAATSSVLAMRWAFLRGAARQWGNLTATYRSCNFGDSSTIFSDTQSYHAPQNFYDNFYSVISGAGMTWYKMDIWYQYMAGASMFYHEQGFDEFWQPGGTTAAGLYDVQLSPKGKLVDRFLRATAVEPDRGTPFTPVAFLVDYAHGWEPAPFWPNSFKNWHGHQDRFLFGDHEKMLEQYFWTAFHPIGAESERPMTATNEVYVPGVFGDIFDVILAYPDTSKWRTIDSYPVVIAAGDTELTEAEGQRLAQYMEQGGTLLVTADQFTGPGVAALNLPPVGAVSETTGYRWLANRTPHSPSEAVTPVASIPPEIPADNSQSQRFRFHEITPSAESGFRPLATTDDGRAFCASLDRGAGRLIYLSIPRGLGIDRSIHPIVPRLFAHLTRGLMPIEVDGDVEWLVNKSASGWLVTLMNPAGQTKPQHGITPTDYSQNRRVTIRSHVPIASARDRLLPNDVLPVNSNSLQLEIPAGGVRIVELR